MQDAVVKMKEARDPPRLFLHTVLGLPRARFGSGTSWQPDQSPLYVALPHWDRYGFLIGGNVFAGYNYFSSERGGRRFMGRNNLSFAGFARFRKAELMARVMITFEPFTVGHRGYPLILQTGQKSDGEPIHDRQNAFEFFRELALIYSQELARGWAMTLYLAASGEPALGPGTFTHRVSASADPLAPLGFRWTDSAQTSFGVVTFAAFTRALRLEASWFNGLEPGERRYGVDLVRVPDSSSARVTWNPHPSLSLQTSYAYLHRPQRARAVANHRVSSSISYTRWGEHGGSATTFALAERVLSTGDATFSVLLESYWLLADHHAPYGRLELVQKTAAELALPLLPAHQNYAVGTLVAGYVYYFGPFISLQPGLGVRASLSPLARELEPSYGTRAPFGIMVYAQLRTAAMPVNEP